MLCCFDSVLGGSGFGDVATLTLSSCGPLLNNSGVGDVATWRDRCEDRRRSGPSCGVLGLSGEAHGEQDPAMLFSEATVLPEAIDIEQDSVVGIVVKRFGLLLDTQQHLPTQKHVPSRARA